MSNMILLLYVCKTVILVMSNVVFLKVCFNGSDLFILLMHIPTSYQVHVLHTNTFLTASCLNSVIYA